VASEDTAVMLSSHLLHLVEELASRILVMAQGRIVASGSVSDIAASRPELAGRGLEDVFLALTDTAHAVGADASDGAVGVRAGVREGEA
jgi:ABC-2 type transport system ATP-binding protein